MAVLPKSIVNLPSQVCIRVLSRAITDISISLSCVLFFLIRYILSSSRHAIFFAYINTAMLVSWLLYSAIMATSPPALLKKRVNITILWRLSSKVCPIDVHRLGLYWPRDVVIQTMVSQVILGVRYVLSTFCGLRAAHNHATCRTFNISGRDKRIGIALVLLYIILVSVCFCHTNIIFSFSLVLARVVHRSVFPVP